MMPLWIFLITFIGLWPSICVLTLMTFRQRIKPVIFNIILTSFLMAQITLLLQLLPIKFAITILQPIAFTLCLRYILKYRFFHSIIMSIISFFFNIIAEVTFYLISSKFNFERFIMISQEAVILPSTYLTIINYLVSYILFRLRLGFTFITVRNAKGLNHRFSKRSYYILGFSYISIFPLCLWLYHWNNWILISLVFISFLFLGLIQFFYQKEMETD